MAKKPAANSALTIASWNVNSVRRMGAALQHFVAQHNPDVICMQETKVIDDLFPREAFVQLGYPHLAVSGQKMHHGVAIASRLPFERSEMLSWCAKEDKRHVAVTLPGGIELHNFYVPAGGDIPDATVNPKFGHKLQFVDEMIDWSAKRKKKKLPRTVLVGDLNIAPHENDVWSHKQLLKVVSHTPVETERMARLYAAGDWQDAVRKIVPVETKLYSWWSYRSPDWQAADKGRRLDHVWVTPDLHDAVRHAEVAKAMRGHEPASDHAPVIVRLTL